MKPLYNIVYRKKNESWAYQITVKDAGIWKYHSSKQGFNLRKEAVAAAQKAVKDIKIQPEAAAYTLRKIVELYIDKGTRSESTRDTYRSWAKNLESILDKQPADVTRVDAESVISAYYATHLYNGTNSLRTFASSVYRYAIKSLEIDCKNPFDAVEVEIKSGKAPKKIKVLTMAQVHTLVNSLTKNHEYEAAFLVGLMGYCGLRIGEARGVRQDSLMTTERMVKITHQRYASGVVTKVLKTANSERELRYSPRLDKVIRNLPAPIKKDTLYVSDVHTSRDIKRACNRAGFEDVNPHLLRHSYATSMLERGVDIKTLSDLLGDTVETVLKTYAHVNTEMLDKAFKIASEF